MFFDIDNFGALKNALAQMCSSFGEDVPEEALFNCKLVASELLSNALRYGGGRARFTVERCGDEIRIHVKSENAYVPPVESVCSDVDSECGRGLFLVDAVSESRLYSKEEGICVVVRIEED